MTASFDWSQYRNRPGVAKTAVDYNPADYAARELSAAATELADRICAHMDAPGRSWPCTPAHIAAVMGRAPVWVRNHFRACGAYVDRGPGRHLFGDRKSVLVAASMIVDGPITRPETIARPETSGKGADEPTSRRPAVPALEAVLGKSFSVLDHGFVRVVDYMGDDGAIVQAARVSYGKGTRKVSEDRGLIRYLMRHRHTTPFEMCSIKLHVKLPIFVARQWIRHRTASVNEYSARYSVLDREFYVPGPEAVAAQSSLNGQGRGDVLDPGTAARMVEILREDADRNHNHYLWLLNEAEDGGEAEAGRPGLARELARINLTLGTYTQWYWKTDLHNLMHFLALRGDGHAQHEIRVYADEIERIFRLWTPLAAEAFDDYRRGSVVLSRQMAEAVRRMLAGERVDRESSGLSVREWREFHEALGREPPTE